MKYKVGKIVEGTVTGIETYGAFVSFDEFYSGLIHISEISEGFVNDVNEFLTIGDIIKTRIIGIDEENNHLKLSIKEFENLKPKRRKRGIRETKGRSKQLFQLLPKWIEKEEEKLAKRAKVVDNALLK
jgi:predicted RNA-binding protein with RPS1 domain